MDSQFRIAHVHPCGDGVERSDEEAYPWFASYEELREYDEMLSYMIPNPQCSSPSR